MLFNSAIFFLFLPLVLAGYYCLGKRCQNLLLLVASYVFYGYWDWRFLALLMVSTVVDYTIARCLDAQQDPRRRKTLLLVSIFTNLGILGFFKYFGFFVESLAGLLQAFGFEPHLPTLHIVLPVGISFYTFQTLSYTIDVYRREMPAEKSLELFALFVAFFPQLVAGPIERVGHLLPQLRDARRVTWPGIAVGLELMLLGYFKKVGVADTLGPLVDPRFLNPEASSGKELLLSAYFFSFQIYCDFSGYSDIARGVSRLFGVQLIRNFDQPYLSRSITEFWRRWHMSLSSWLRDYLYISLGGNRRGELKTYRNLMLTMLIGGLWHGASWTFVVWGGLHGLYLAVHKLWLARTGRTRPDAARGPLPIDLLKMLATFHLVTLTWIFFRSATFADAWAYLTGIVTWRAPTGAFAFGEVTAMRPYLLVLLVPLVLIDVWQYVRGDHAFMVRWQWPWRALAYSALLVTLLVFGNVNQDVPFIYFQF
jgi:D-alanyl-lipoteichoic acid acyltransferase DltB (MBOAT superfamily)